MLSRHTHQAHGIIGARGYGISDERRLPLALLVNILGGPSANSLLYIELREKRGLSYNVEATYTPYSDCGIVGVYFSSDHANMEECVGLIEENIANLLREPISQRRLSIASVSSWHRWLSRWSPTRAICLVQERATCSIRILIHLRRPTRRLCPSLPRIYAGWLTRA